MSPPSGPMRGRRHGPSMPTEKAADFRGTIVKLARYCRPYLPAILLAVVFAALGAVMSVIGPNFVGDLSDLISEGIPVAGHSGVIDMDAVMRISVILLSIYAASWVFNFLQGYIMATTSQRIARTMRSEISAKINRMPLRYFDRHQFGDTLSRVTNDVDSVGVALNSSIGSLVNALAMLLGCLVMMLWTNWIMAGVAIIATVFGFVLMFTIMRRSQKYFVGQQRVLGEVNGQIEEVYSGHTVVKAFNGEDGAIGQFVDANGRLYNNAWKSQFFSGMMMPLMGFVGNLGYVAVCITGSVLMVQGHADIGTIVSFMIYVRLFTSPLNLIAQANTSIQSAAAAGERVFEFLGEEEMEDESSKTASIEQVRGKVEFDHVRFGYLPDKTIIHDLSFTAESGSKVAIVGPTGAGKTTLVNLLMRFYDPDSGEIRIDGIPTSDMPREKVRDLFCMILQDTWIFEGTIRENIVYSEEGVTDEDVMRACDAVGMTHFVNTLPDGLDTVLDDRASISAGQRQQITIARAIIENAPLLILDEATSSVDTRTERVIQKAMDDLTVGRTSFVIAHRLSTIRNADVILVMRDGDIKEIGNHDELMARNGYYAELYNSQFEE